MILHFIGFCLACSNCKIQILSLIFYSNDDVQLHSYVLLMKAVATGKFGRIRPGQREYRGIPGGLLFR